MIVWQILVLCFFTSYGVIDCKIINPRRWKLRSQATAITNTKQDLHTINIMLHLDNALTEKLKPEYGPKTRKKLKYLANKIILEAETIFLPLSETSNVHFKLLGIKFLRNKTTVVEMNENVSKYLRSYCDWQSQKKESRNFYSVLLTGLDVFYLKNGKEVRRSTGRSYNNGMCNVEHSCTILEYHPKNSGYLLAHEIAHSLGIKHDGAPDNECSPRGFIMAPSYNSKDHPKTWSTCSRRSIKEYFESDSAKCLR